MARTRKATCHAYSWVRHARRKGCRTPSAEHPHPRTLQATRGALTATATRATDVDQRHAASASGSGGRVATPVVVSPPACLNGTWSTHSLALCAWSGSAAAASVLERRARDTGCAGGRGDNAPACPARLHPRPPRSSSVRRRVHPAQCRRRESAHGRAASRQAICEYYCLLNVPFTLKNILSQRSGPRARLKACGCRSRAVRPPKPLLGPGLARPT